MVKKAKAELQEAMLWQKERNGIRCFACARKCFISKDKFGYCQVRKNVGNKLFTLNYGKIRDASVEPIEKKPLFHFYPSSKTLTLTSVGTNLPADAGEIFRDKEQEKVFGSNYTPEQVVRLAEKKKVNSLTYNSAEPFIFFEFAYRAAKLAHRSSIKNVFVTNSFITEDAVKKAVKYLDAALIVFKASADPVFYKNYMDIADLEPIFDSIKKMKKHRVHVEIADIVVPQIGDNLENCRKLVQWISTELGAEVPFHVMQFYPDKKLSELPPTPVSTLERTADEARKTGLRYVYIISAPSHADESTVCYNCRELLVQRFAQTVKKNNLQKDRCPNCGVRINIVS